ncbi:MAG: tRNA preQ1(34) S-adenosylmethionine ribosyltransferase-isomerase QueA [Candidatus Omnitrophota bacterium]|nr:MAG: tRNA preQ1(34) S-adenosylmethionine ribosyltransferase-isomerase QueA [Candidatus Omnitrophota bacterium]
MKLSDFDYSLPEELIAQYPSNARGDDRLLVLDRAKNSFRERVFADIADYFKEGDLLVLNDTKVIPARLFARRKTGANVEIFIIDKTKNPVEALVRPSGRIKENESVILDSGDEARVLGSAEIGRLVEFNRPVEEILERYGHVPLPPYITRRDEPGDKKRYQTIYAKEEGATASPTAGLHFTEDLIDKLKKKGVELAYITLHVNYGTFAPVKEEIVERHEMHSEFYHISEENASIINKARKRCAKIFACGTTSLRALETYADSRAHLNADSSRAHLSVPYCCSVSGFTNLFIYPGFKFKMANVLITNFHLPKSTLILLTSAFAGKDLLFKAYRYAIEKSFRFFSYGDAMLII